MSENPDMRHPKDLSSSRRYTITETAIGRQTKRGFPVGDDNKKGKSNSKADSDRSLTLRELKTG